MTTTRLEQQLRFIAEVDRLKGVLRQTTLLDGSRRENSAEHSWHIAIMAIILAEHADDHGLDLSRVVRMLLIHDIVEVDAGDTFCYDTEGMGDKLARERRAADRIFGLLPPDLETALHALWDEFEARETPEARFANALDRLQPVLHNLLTEGNAWRRHGIEREQVLERNAVIGEAAAALWEHVRPMIDEAASRGWLRTPGRSSR
jgi:putative hydrolase of HD superfamily